MSGLLNEAIKQMTSLPETDQDQIGRDLLSHIEKLRRLRAEIDRGLRSLDEGKGRPLDIEDFVRNRHGGG